MTMTASAIWRRLDVPGHDVCWLHRHNDGWTLQGSAIYCHETGPACLHYRTTSNFAWETVSGEVYGRLGDREISYQAARAGTEWTLNGVAIPELRSFLDLDFGFTPATNYQQLQRIGIALHQSAEIVVAWLDVDAGTLTALPQRYERLSASTYRYEAPTFEYEGLLKLAPNGFIQHYPGLWAAEAMGRS